jgi:hypothetical protein
MAQDIEQELDALLAPHKARVAEARNAAAGRVAAEESFGAAATVCMTNVITPALQHMAQALNDRGVAARVSSDGGGARIDIPVGRHARLGQGHGGYPYLRARPDREAQRIRFERNTSDSRGASAVGNHTIAEVSPELIKALVMDLVRHLYGPA